MKAVPVDIDTNKATNWLNQNFYFMIYHKNFCNPDSPVFSNEIMLLNTLYGLLFHHSRSDCSCNRLFCHSTEYLVNKTDNLDWELRCRRCHAMELLHEIIETNSVDMLNIIKKLPMIITLKCSCRAGQLSSCSICNFNTIKKYYRRSATIKRVLDLEKRSFITLYK